MVQVFDRNLAPTSLEMQLYMAAKCCFLLLLFFKAFIKPSTRIIYMY